VWGNMPSRHFDPPHRLASIHSIAINCCAIKVPCRDLGVFYSHVTIRSEPTSYTQRGIVSGAMPNASLPRTPRVS